MKAHWPLTPTPGNFGDILTPVLVEKLTGVKLVHVTQPFPHNTLLGIGSIIRFAENKSIVWGSGIISNDDHINTEALYLSVRGPLTRNRVLSQGGTGASLWGDPALLLPEIYNPEPTHEFKYGIFPHYVDFKVVSEYYSGVSDVLVINPINANPLEVVNQVLRCDTIVSSSLHGIIVAHAYGMPAIWVEYSDKITGDKIKYYDYFESVNVKSPPPIDQYECGTLYDLDNMPRLVCDIDLKTMMRPVVTLLKHAVTNSFDR